MDENMFLPENIETVFKVEQPISEVGNGYFGYSGVLLRDKEKDLVQCHLCGKWFENLSQHVVGKHEIKSIQYRKMFGLPLHFPLCNKKYSELCRNTILNTLKNRKKPQRVDPSKNGTRKKAVSKEGLENHFYSYNNASWDNKHGGCPEQLQKRYLSVADIVGGNPTKKDLEEHDPPLYSLIYRRGMTLNEFREKYGFEKNISPEKIETALIISRLREFKAKNKRLPRFHDFRKGTPSMSTILRRFGSLRKALMVANVIE